MTEAGEEEAAAEDQADEPIEAIGLPAQPWRVISSLLALAAGVASYGFVLVNFWSSPWLGIHLRTPYPAYLLMAAALILTLSSLRLSLGILSPHLKLGI